LRSASEEAHSDTGMRLGGGLIPAARYKTLII